MTKINVDHQGIDYTLSLFLHETIYPYLCYRCLQCVHCCVRISPLEGELSGLETREYSFAAMATVAAFLRILELLRFLHQLEHSTGEARLLTKHRKIPM